MKTDKKNKGTELNKTLFLSGIMVIILSLISLNTIVIDNSGYDIKIKGIFVLLSGFMCITGLALIFYSLKKEEKE